MVRRPKAYGFDTGFVSFVRGWHDIRDDDRGLLWEHLVLDVLRSVTGMEGLFYWRDKSGREVDFVVRRGRAIHAVECKINPDRFDPESLRVFVVFIRRAEIISSALASKSPMNAALTN